MDSLGRGVACTNSPTDVKSSRLNEPKLGLGLELGLELGLGWAGAAAPGLLPPVPRVDG